MRIHTHRYASIHTYALIFCMCSIYAYLLRAGDAREISDCNTHARAHAHTHTHAYTPTNMILVHMYV